jgi:Domain of unknown function (DUF4082)
VLVREKKLSWRILFDPFTPEKNFRRILFGKRGDIPFLFRARGTQDSLAVVTKNKIIYRGLFSSIKRRIRLGQLKFQGAPLTLRGADGRDTLLFANREINSLTVTSINGNSNGKERKEHRFQGVGTLVVGDFGTGTTFGYLRAHELELADGTLLKVSTNGVPVANQLYYTFEKGEASSTPLPTPTMTATITSIPTETASPIPSGTLQPTYISCPTNTVKATHTPTLTATNTATATITLTSTSTSTFTVPPTYTPYPTFTPVPTLTPTFTPTVTPSNTPLSAENIWGAKTGSAAGDGGAYSLGTIFQANIPGTITHIRVYSVASEAGNHTARIWRNSDNALIAGPFTINYGGTNGWTTHDIADVAIDAATSYTVSVTTGVDFPRINNDLASGGTNGQHLSYPSTAGVYTSTLNARPTSNYQNSNYLRDIIFVGNNETPSYSSCY